MKQVISRIGVVGFLFIAFASITGACSSSSPAKNTSPPTTGGLFKSPGTPIVGGVRVQPGSRLVGMTIPQQRFTGTPILSSISLVQVTRDPNKVFLAYYRAFNNRGYGLRQPTCDIDGPTSGAVICESSSDSTHFKTHPYVELSMAAPATPGSSFDTTLMIFESHPDPLVPTTTQPPAPVPAEQVVNKAGMRLQTETRVPRVGQLIAPASMDPGVKLPVMKGSELLLPAAPLNGGSLGYVTIAQITGNPEAVRNAYLQHKPHDKVQTVTQKVGDQQVWFGRWDSPGGAKLNLVNLETPNGTSLLFINVQND